MTPPTTPQWQTDRLAAAAPQQGTDALERAIALALRIELGELDSRTRHELATFVARLDGEVRAMHGAGRDSKAVSADRVAALVQDLLTATATH